MYYTLSSYMYMYLARYCFKREGSDTLLRFSLAWEKGEEKNMEVETRFILRPPESITNFWPLSDTTWLKWVVLPLLFPFLLLPGVTALLLLPRLPNAAEGLCSWTFVLLAEVSWRFFFTLLDTHCRLPCLVLSSWPESLLGLGSCLAGVTGSLQLRAG